MDLYKNLQRQIIAENVYLVQIDFFRSPQFQLSDFELYKDLAVSGYVCMKVL